MGRARVYRRRPSSEVVVFTFLSAPFVHVSVKVESIFGREMVALDAKSSDLYPKGLV